MGTTAAIYYSQEAYNTTGSRLLGRRSAGEGFLKSFVRYQTAEALYCYTQSEKGFSQFCEQIRPWVQQPTPVRWIPENEHELLGVPGVVYRPDPALSTLAWSRRFVDQRAYSLCGITHTIGTKVSMAAIGDLITAPLQPWDALICTSPAVKTAIEHLFGTWLDYLGQRLGYSSPPTLSERLQLPVIPLGVDFSAFPTPEAAITTRHQQRQQFNISPDDIVVLFLGRLSFSAKAHPVPMYLALEKAAQATGARIHLIHAGWIEDKREEPLLHESLKAFAPSVNPIFVDGRLPQIRREIWSSADIFISLADNIQETFGLTPIEAMANGLPVIVSDWNGYQESVRDEIDGFRIPTMIPPVGVCDDLVANYFQDRYSWPTYMGYTSITVSVDIEICAKRLTQLIQSPELRHQMGENGRKRAQTVYGWDVVIAAYQQLWQELGELRVRGIEGVPVTATTPRHPLCDDPFKVFGHYSTEVLHPDLKLRLGSSASRDTLKILRRLWLTRFGANRRTAIPIQTQILSILEEVGEMSVAEIVNTFASESVPGSSDLISPEQMLFRTLVYLLKLDILVIARD